MARENILREKSFCFAIRILRLNRYIKSKCKETEIAAQILRSGTAIGALIREAEYAESRKDFIHKLRISLKEANECNYWIELLMAAGHISRRQYDSLIKDNQELLKLLIASIRTALKGKTATIANGAIH